MIPDRTLTFRRVPFAQVCRSLSSLDLQVLVTLATTACPRTGRVWTTPLRLAEEFTVAPVTIDASLTTLVARGHLTLYARSHTALRCYEIGHILVRRLDEPPANLPVEPLP